MRGHGKRGGRDNDFRRVAALGLAAALLLAATPVAILFSGPPQRPTAASAAEQLPQDLAAPDMPVIVASATAGTTLERAGEPKRMLVADDRSESTVPESTPAQPAANDATTNLLPQHPAQPEIMQVQVSDGMGGTRLVTMTFDRSEPEEPKHWSEPTEPVVAFEPEPVAPQKKYTTGFHGGFPKTYGLPGQGNTALTYLPQTPGGNPIMLVNLYNQTNNFIVPYPGGQPNMLIPYPGGQPSMMIPYQMPRLNYLIPQRGGQPMSLLPRWGNNLMNFIPKQGGGLMNFRLPQGGGKQFSFRPNMGGGSFNLPRPQQGGGGFGFSGGKGMCQR
jgi:hypothetical protein